MRSARTGATAFILATWAISRLLVFLAFAIAAPHGVLAALGNWDGAWYGSIAAHGYEFARDGAAHNLAFFPLFPMLSRALMVLVSWPLAGVIVNNAAFLATLFVLFAYVRETIGERSARWTVMVASFFPLSLFVSVAYSEGLFLLTSSLALYAYHRKQFAFAGIAAGATALTRPFGFALVVGLMLVAIVQRRNAREILGVAIGVVGAAAFPIYCWSHFGDAFAFVHAQTSWRHGGIDAWVGLFRGAAELRNWHDKFTLLFLAVAVALTAVFRERIGLAGTVFVGLALVTIALSGSPVSIDRFLYGLAPVLIAVGEGLRLRQILGYVGLAVFAALLLVNAMTFARNGWVA